MPNCGVPGCTNQSSTYSEKSFHRLSSITKKKKKKERFRDLLMEKIDPRTWLFWKGCQGKAWIFLKNYFRHFNTNLEEMGGSNFNFTTTPSTPVGFPFITQKWWKLQPWDFAAFNKTLLETFVPNLVFLTRVSLQI